MTAKVSAPTAESCEAAAALLGLTAASLETALTVKMVGKFPVVQVPQPPAKAAASAGTAPPATAAASAGASAGSAPRAKAAAPAGSAPTTKGGALASAKR